MALADLELSPSEVHGTITGAVTNHLKSGITPDLMALVNPGSDSKAGALAQLQELLYELYRVTSEQLFEAKENFELLLPDDDESLAERTDATAAWARGYLLGLLYNSAFSIDQIPESGAEIARDLMQISEAEAGADDEQAEDFALAELQEYIKVGAQLIFEFIYTERASQAPEQSH